MKRLPKNALYLLLIAGLLLTGCELFSGTATPNNNSDTGYTWAREKALEAVNSEYPDGGFDLAYFYSKRVNFFGQLDEAMYSPFWEFVFGNDTRDELTLSVYKDGRVAVFEDDRQHENFISGEYDDAAIRYWLTITREVYRRFTGREDDVSYRVSRYYDSREGEDRVSVKLYDSNSDDIAYMRINPENGCVIEFFLQ